jgi:hypothetical protein
MSRLPIIGGDLGAWGTVLNDFLAVSFNSDGTLKANAMPVTRSTAPQFVGSRNTSGSVVFMEDFRSPAFGFWNDGVGSSTRDCDVSFSGLPSLRLDAQGNASAGATSPGRTAITTGVVAKRRILDGFSGQFGVECWFRMSSLNLTTNTFFSLSLYNRDGTSAWHGRVWLNPNGNNVPMIGQILDGAATATANGGAPLTGPTAIYTTVSTSVLQNGAGTHTYDPPTGRLDRAGGWHYVKLIMDMANKTYVSLTLDGQPTVSLTGYQMDQTTSAGYAGMHFSVEFSATTSSARFVNVAQVIGTDE